jgi:hypothetical protein
MIKIHGDNPVVELSLNPEIYFMAAAEDLEKSHRTPLTRIGSRFKAESCQSVFA